MCLYVIISLFLTMEYAYNTDLLTHQYTYTDNNLECLTDALYRDFTDKEYNNLVNRRKKVRKSMNKNLGRETLETLYVPIVFHNLFKTVDGTAINSYCDFGYDVLLNDNDTCNVRMWRSLEVLNAQYKPSGIQFKLHDNYPEMLVATDEGYDGFFEDATGATSTTVIPNTIKKHYNIANALNIYTHECLPTKNTSCNQGKLGFSTYSWTLDSNYPGIFIKHKSLPGSANKYPPAEGSNVGVLAHEIGHYFSLQHINGTWFLLPNNTPRELAFGDDCEIHGDLICDTPGEPGYIPISTDIDQSYYLNNTTRECIYHGYGGLYNPETSMLQIGGYTKSFYHTSFPNTNYCENWNFVDYYNIDKNCTLFTNYDRNGNFYGARDLPIECYIDEKADFATECHIDQYKYLPIGNNFMQSGTRTHEACSIRPIGHDDYDPSNHGFTSEQFSNIRESLELDYTACSDEKACNTGLSIRNDVNEEYLLRSGESSCLYPCNKQESVEYYEEFHPGCLIDEGYPIDNSQDDCSENLLSFNKNIIPQNFGINQIYPNPFNPITTIRYGVNQNTNIQVLIYNIQGRVITTLIDEFQTAGYHSVIWDASKFSSGIYFLNMSNGEIAETKKMVLIK